jgi:hypothetical protein
MIKLACPPGYAPERRYIADVMLREFLGLEFRLEQEDRRDWRLTLDDDAGGSEILIPDGLFTTPEAQWLTAASLPGEKTACCSPDDRPCPPAPSEDRIPLLFTAQQDAPGMKLEGGRIQLAGDIFGGAFYMLSRYEELVQSGLCTDARFPADQSTAHKLGVLNRPLVNEYLELLWAALQRLWPRLERVPRNYRVVPTHDIDGFATAWRSPLSVLKSTAADVVLRRDPRLACNRLQNALRVRRGELRADLYWVFEDMMDTAEAQGLSSTFYFIVEPRFLGLEHPEILALFKQIHARGHAIGVHPTHGTSLDPTAILRAKQAVVRALEKAGVPAVGLGARQHWLEWSCPETWQAYEDAGLAHDSSMSFAHLAGFRSGTCYEHPIFNLRSRQTLRLRERPLILMETTLYKYERQSEREKHNRMRQLKEQCRKHRGDFTILWHNASLIDRRRTELFRQTIKP